MAAKKRPVSLELAMQGGDPEPAASESQAPRLVVPEVEKLTVYVPRAAARRLKQMALDNDKRVNDFLQEGVDLMLAKYGQPSLAELKGK
jgi:hypothetical protein